MILGPISPSSDDNILFTRTGYARAVDKYIIMGCVSSPAFIIEFVPDNPINDGFNYTRTAGGRIQTIGSLNLSLSIFRVSTLLTELITL
jgi:hypothetical protein